MTRPDTAFAHPKLNGKHLHPAPLQEQDAATIIRTTLGGIPLAAHRRNPRPFSVLMSLYYKENPVFLRKSLESVFDQSVIPDEVVLVKDGPLTDELEQVVKEFTLSHPQMKIVALKENGGLGRALDAGLRECSHELVARMDTDDIAKHNRFERQLEAFETFPDVDLVNAWIDEFESDPEVTVSTRKLPEFPFELYRYGKKRCPVNHPSVMFKKHSVLMAGSYRHFHMFEDYHLWVRLLLSGAKFYTIQESLLHFRASEAMFERRGGLRYAREEIRLQWHMWRMGYINALQLGRNVAIRFTTRIVPNSLRTFIYKKFLRR